MSLGDELFVSQPGDRPGGLEAPHDGEQWRTNRPQAALLRCIFGNPFRPAAFAPAWLSETAVALATGIYDERAFDRLPILADALEEAGCDDEAILAHCRGEGPHVRGCWVAIRCSGGREVATPSGPFALG